MKVRAHLSERAKAGIDAGKHIGLLLKIQQRLEDGWRTMDACQIAANALQVKISLAFIAKTVPDIKAVEIQGDIRQHQSWDPLPLTAQELTKLSSTFIAGVLPSPSGIDAPEKPSGPSMN